MKYLTSLASVSIPIFLLLSFSSCKKEFPTKSLSASFQIREFILHPDFYRVIETYDTDSVTTSNVEFIANEPESGNVRYEWKIGSDSRIFTGRKLTLDFQYTYENEIDISLTVRKVDTLNPANNDIKTSLRTFYLKRPSMALGTFEGYFENDARKATLKIQDNFLHPVSLVPGISDYQGILLTETSGLIDTLFLTNDANPYLFLNRKLVFRPTTIIHYADYPFNKRVEGPVGEIYVDPKTKNVSLDLTVREVSSGSSKRIRFSGIKIL